MPFHLNKQPFFELLDCDTRRFLLQQAALLHLSFDESRQICEIALDLQMWGNGTIRDAWPDASLLKATGKLKKQQLMGMLRSTWEIAKSTPNHYCEDKFVNKTSAASKPVAIEKGRLGLGRCPVASPRTLCCNLQTLDAVDNCGYGCSYCSIQSFFDGKQRTFDKGFAHKLKALKLDPDKTYHIGTGQSSDSLMWGNSHGVLDAVIDFARENPNVILELKTKSANVGYFLSVDAPRNIFCTWSLNTPTLVKYEEQGTASVEKRLVAARKIADAGFIVGFHFHPIIHYDNWKEDYKSLVEKLTSSFQPKEVALISMGTLTYIKSVLREIRKKAISSQILKMPMVDADGKLSYPDNVKLLLFKHVYENFPRQWHEKVFFYLCMENQRFWEPVFGYQYESNVAFEDAMKVDYISKIQQ